jgi:transcription antitermination factor NusG
LRSTIKYWSDRKKKILEPLVPSYVFVRVNELERYLSLRQPGVVRMVTFNNRPARIPENEIESLRSVLKHGFVPEPYHYLSSGEAVEIVAGPLQGVSGYFIEERGLSRLAISVHAIKQTLAIEVSRCQIKKIGRDNISKEQQQY